jgi:hypothetical protein
MLCLDVETSESHHWDYGKHGGAPTSKLYRKSFHAWHQNLTRDTAHLPLPHSHAARRFSAPGPNLVPDYQVERARRGLPDPDSDPPQQPR